MNNITGWYYLHENGELIYKPDYDDVVADFRESDLVKCFWPLDVHDRKGAWDILVESLALGADMKRVEQLAELWKCDDNDADNYANKLELKFTRDGDLWAVTGPRFTNIQEANIGFGISKLYALADYARTAGLQAGKMWRNSFSDLVKTIN